MSEQRERSIRAAAANRPDGAPQGGTRHEGTPEGGTPESGME
jgi:hypothetical protein